MSSTNLNFTATPSFTTTQTRVPTSSTSPVAISFGSSTDSFPFTVNFTSGANFTLSSDFSGTSTVSTVVVPSGPPSAQTPPSNIPNNSNTSSGVISISNTLVIIISVCAAVVVVAIGAITTYCLRRRQRRRQYQRGKGTFVAIPNTATREKFAPVSRNSTHSSFYSYPTPVANPRTVGYQDTAHSPLLQEAWRQSFDTPSMDYVVPDPQARDSDRSTFSTITPHTRTPSQSTTRSNASSLDTATIMSSAPVKVNHSPYRQSIPLTPLTIPTPAPSTPKFRPGPPPPPPPPPPPSSFQRANRKPSTKSRRTTDTYDSDGSESIYSQASGYPPSETPVAHTAKTSHTHHTLSTMEMPSGIEFNGAYPTHPARASSVFSAHPQFMNMNVPLAGTSAPLQNNHNNHNRPGSSGRGRDLEEGIKRPEEALYAPIAPVVINYDSEKEENGGRSRGDSMIIGKLLKSRAMHKHYRESGSTVMGGGGGGVGVTRNSSMVSHIEREGSIKEVASPLVSDDQGGRQRMVGTVYRQPVLSTTVEDFYFKQDENDREMGLPPSLANAATRSAAAAGEFPSPTGAAEGETFSPMSPPTGLSAKPHHA